MMIVPGASVLRYSTAVRLYSGSNSTESSGRSPGWSPTSGCCAKLCETERIRPAAAITVRIRCRNFVIPGLPLVGRCPVFTWFAGTIKSQGWRDGKQSRYPAGMLSIFVSTDRCGRGPESSLRREPQPQAIGHDGHGADPAEPK